MHYSPWTNPPMQNNPSNCNQHWKYHSQRIHQTQKSIQWRKIPMTPKTHHMGSRNWTTFRSTHYNARTTPTPQPKRNQRGSQVCIRTPCVGHHTRIVEPICSKLLLCKERGWKTMTSSGLQTNQQMDNEKLQHLPINSPSHWPTQRLHTLYKSWCSMGIQQHLNQRRRQMESHLPYSGRTIWTYHNVLWSHQFPSHFSNNDEHHLLDWSHTRMAIGLYGWHCHPHKTRKTWNKPTTCPPPLPICPPHAKQTWTKWLIPQTRKMWLWTKGDWLPQCHCWKWKATNGPKETQRSRRLAKAEQPNQHPQIPWIHWLLSLLHTRLFKDCMTTPQPH